MKHMNVFRSRGFSQYVNGRTHNKDGTLDLVYANGDETKNLICKVHEEIGLGSDHYPITIKLDINEDITEDGRTHKYKRILDPNNTNYEEYEKEMDQQAEFIDELNDENGDQDEITIKITERILEIYDKHVKTKLVEIPKYDEPSAALRHANNRMRNLRRKKNATKEEFEEASKAVREEAEKDRYERQRAKVKKCLKNDGRTWKTVKEIKMETGMSRSKYYAKDGTLTTTDEEAANVLAAHYASVAINVSPPLDYSEKSPDGWTTESLRTIVERRRGFGMFGRNVRTNDRLRTRSYDFNTSPIDFDQLKYPKVGWIAGDIPFDKEFENYYGFTRPSINLVNSDKWREENKNLFAINPDTQLPCRVTELPATCRIKFEERRNRKLGKTNILYNTEEEIIFPEDIPDWWVTNHSNTAEPEQEMSYYGYRTYNVKEIVLRKALDTDLKNRLIYDGRTGKLLSAAELSAPGKLRAANRIVKEQFSRENNYELYLDFDEDLLTSTEFGWKARAIDNGRPLLSRRNKYIEVPTPDWWIPGMASPHTAKAIKELKSKNLPKKEEDAELEKLREKFRVTVDNGPMTYDQAVITEEILGKAVAKSNASSAPGYDNVFPNVIKKAGKAILGVLANLFNNCIKKGVFPRVLKIAWIKSLPKKGGDPCDPKNTRPIAILPTIGKLFEASLGILEENFTKTWNANTKWNRRLPKSQYGFKAKSGCSDNLASSLHKIHHACNRGHGVTVTLYDFQKAFDSTSFNNMIIDKVNNGFAALVPIWTDYFKDRTFKVRIGEDQSREDVFISGTPQGAPSSPNHFNQYIRELNDPDNHEKITEELAFGPEEICRSIRAAPVDDQDVELQNSWSRQKKATMKRFMPNLNKQFSEEYFYSDGDTESKKQATREENLLRHLKTDFYADDCKSIAVTGAPHNRKLDKATKFTYYKPLITFGCIQTKILEMEDFCKRRCMKFHPRKCQIIYFGRERYSKEDCYMTDRDWEKKTDLERKLAELERNKKSAVDLEEEHCILETKLKILEIDSKEEKIKIEEVKLVRDLGVWYTVDGNGFLNTDPSFNRMICAARALSIAVKRAIKGAPLDRHVLCFHALIKAQFSFAIETIWKNTVAQRRELNKIYEEYFSDIEIPKNKEEIVMPEPLTSFIKKLCIKRAFRILKGATATRAEDFWTVLGHDRARIEAVKMKCNTIYCWCKTLQQEFMSIRDNKARADPEALMEYLDNHILDEREGLIIRLAVVNGARRYSKINFEKKMKNIRERDILIKKGKEESKYRIAELTRLIETSYSGKITMKFERMNMSELKKENLAIKMKTKNKEEYLEMIARIRQDYDAEDLEPEYEC